MSHLGASSFAVLLLAAMAVWPVRGQDELQPFFIMRRAQPEELQPNWNDKGSGADTDFSSWRFVNALTPNSPFRAFGSLGCNSTYDPAKCLAKNGPVMVGMPAFNTPAVASVGSDNSDFAPVWTDEGSGADVDGSVWKGVAPSFYGSVGDVFTAGRQATVNPVTLTRDHIKPRSNDTWAIWSSCLIDCASLYPGYKPTRIWKDSGSGADHDVSIYSVGVKGTPSYLGTFRAQSNHNTANPQMCIKPQCIKTAQIYQTRIGPTNFDWNSVTGNQAVKDVGSTETVTNPTVATVKSTVTVTYAQDSTTTAFFEQKLSYSSSVEYSKEVEVTEKEDMQVQSTSFTEKAGVQFGFKMGGEQIWSDTSTSTSKQEFTKALEVSVPARTNLAISMAVSKVNNVQVPYNTTFFMQIVDWSVPGPTQQFMSDEQQVLDFLKQTGFSGQVLAWFPSNSTLKVITIGYVRFSSVYRTDTIIQCLGADGNPDNCPDTIAVSPAATPATRAASGSATTASSTPVVTLKASRTSDPKNFHKQYVLNFKVAKKNKMVKVTRTHIHHTHQRKTCSA